MEENKNIRKKYSNSPLKEVVCQFVFDKKINLDEKGKALKEIFESDFPNFDIVEKKTIKNKESLKIHRFIDENKNFFLQLSENFLIINKLSPYNGWDNLKPLIKNLFEKFSNITDQKNIIAIVLKYTNIVKVEEKTINLCEYFNFYPNNPNPNSNLLKFDINVHTSSINKNSILQIKIPFYK